MPTLNYWYSKCPDDSDVYSVRTRTKKEAVAQIAEKPGSEKWPAPRKVTVHYDNAFDLMKQCSIEGHHYWEAG